MVISFDGLGGVRLNDLLSQGKLTAGGFSAIAERGLLAGRAVDITPSLTPSAHIAAITGAPPARNGIVANHFREPGTPFGADTTGFLAPIETETLWEAAHRQGRRVGVLLYPGADGTDARRRGDFGPDLARPAGETSAFATLGSARWTGAGETDAASFSPVRRATLDVSAPGGRTVRLEILARDTTDDGVVDYDTLIVARAGETEAQVERLGWFAVQPRARADLSPPGAASSRSSRRSRASSSTWAVSLRCPPIPRTSAPGSRRRSAAGRGRRTRSSCVRGLVRGGRRRGRGAGPAPRGIPHAGDRLYDPERALGPPRRLPAARGRDPAPLRARSPRRLGRGRHAQFPDRRPVCRGDARGPHRLATRSSSSATTGWCRSRSRSTSSGISRRRAGRSRGRPRPRAGRAPRRSARRAGSRTSTSTRPRARGARRGVGGSRPRPRGSGGAARESRRRDRVPRGSSLSGARQPAVGRRRRPAPSGLRVRALEAVHLLGPD